MASDLKAEAVMPSRGLQASMAHPIALIPIPEACPPGRQAPSPPRDKNPQPDGLESIACLSSFQSPDREMPPKSLVYQGPPRAEVLKARFKRLEIADSRACPMDARQMDSHRDADPPSVILTKIRGGPDGLRCYIVTL